MVIFKRFDGLFFKLVGNELAHVSDQWALFMLACLPVIKHFTATNGIYWHLEHNGTHA